MRERDHMEDPCVNGIINGLQIGRKGVYWIDLAQDRDRWRALVNAVMNLRGKKNMVNFLT
jgi:hypothetical protein